MKKLYAFLLITSLSLHAQDSLNNLKDKATELKNAFFGSKEEEIAFYIINKIEKSASYKNLLENPESSLDAALVNMQKGLYSAVATLKCITTNNGVMSIYYQDWLNGSRQACKKINEQRENARTKNNQKSE
jgi:hypothetical protein